MASADLDNADAKNNLGFCFAVGDGVPQDSDRALKLFEEAANGGQMDAHFNLAISLDKDNMDQRNRNEEKLKRVIELYKKAAEGGHTAAMCNLGVAYERTITKGEASPNLKEAVHWYMKAAEAGNSNAMYNLGLCYEKASISLHGEKTDQGMAELNKYIRHTYWP